MDNRIEQVKKGELVIENDNRFATVDCIRKLCCKECTGLSDFYICKEGEWDYYDKTSKPTIKATELLKLLNEPKFKPNFGDRVLAWDEPSVEKKQSYYISDFHYGYLVVCGSDVFDKLTNGRPVVIYPYKNIAPLPEEITMAEVAKALGKELGTFKIIDNAS